MKSLGFVAALETIQDRRQRGKVTRDIGMTGSQGTLSEGHPPASKGLGAQGPAARVFEITEIVIEGRERHVAEVEWPTDAQPAQVGARRIPVPTLALVDDAEPVEQGCLQPRMPSVQAREQAERIQEQPFGLVVTAGASLAIGPSSQPPRAKEEPGAQRRSGSLFGLSSWPKQGATVWWRLSQRKRQSPERRLTHPFWGAVSPSDSVWRLPK